MIPHELTVGISLCGKSTTIDCKRSTTLSLVVVSDFRYNRKNSLFLRERSV